ncbi:autophagy protein 5-like [Eriocheir sinensis]|uniref:autophagy protein 5-like n=1 Tax=Eriocheir sinensis TaxID=95602 RepID=UPI0021C62303|nr:autophagy protein 5-like [Eriocheir sinensis]
MGCEAVTLCVVAGITWGACCLTSPAGSPCCPGTSRHTSHTSQNSISSTAPQEVVESLFTSSLKEAGGLKHRGQVTTTSLQARDHKHLWMGLWNGRLHCGFTKINRTCKTCQALMSSVEEIGILS